MKTLRASFFFTLVSAVCLSLASCGDDDPEPANGGDNDDDDTPSVTIPDLSMNTPDALLGKWEYTMVDEDGDSETMIFTFKPNGIATMDKGYGYPMLGSCSTQGKKLLVDFAAIKGSGTYSVTGDRLTFNAKWSSIDDDGIFTWNMTMKKISDETGFTPDKVTGPIVGSWEIRYDATTTQVFTFYKNGLLRYYQPESEDFDLIVAYFCYKVEGNKLSLYDAEGNPSQSFFYGQHVDFDVDNDILSITVEGETIYLNAVK